MTGSGEQTPENDPTEKSEDRGNRKQQEAEQSISVEVSLGRRAEESLATPEETLHLMIAAAENYGFLVIDGDGRITSWNPGAAKLFGWPEEEILNQPFARLFTEEDQQRGVPEAELKKAAEQGAADDDRWHVRKDGTRFWTHGVTTALKNDSVRGFVKIVRDLTEQKQAEERIRRSEQQHRNLVEQVSDYAIFRIDTQGRPTTWNRGVERVLGFAEEDFVGKDINRIFLTEDVKARVPQRELEEAERNGMASNTRWMRREDGTPFYAVGMTTALKDDHGQLVGFTKVMQDRTEQKRQSDELAEKSKQLAAANEQKDHFLAVLSHELRNPLAPIRTAAEIICDEESQNPTVREACDILRRQVQVMVRLVDDLLEANRITTGKVRLQKEAIDLREVAGRAVESTRSLVEGHSHNLSVSLPDEAVRLDADPIRIEQVIVNLLTNAAKYTPEGGKIWLTVEQENATAVVRVRDNGEGIDRDMLSNLFTLFSQADKSLDSSEGGMGIGLALVRSLVELHGGTVEAQSEVGKGSEFTIRLPISDRPSEENETSEVSDAIPPSLRILVVDDNADAAKLTAMLLSARGHDVRAETSGATALDTTEDFRPHAIILDIGMPGMDGYEFARHIRSRPSLGGVTLIAVTGYGQEVDRQQAKEAGIDHHLVKPVEGKTLMTLLDDMEPTSN